MDNFTVMLTTSILNKKEGFAGEIAFILPNDLKISSQKNTLCRNLYLTDIGYYPKALYHNRERTYGSNEYVLIYCVQGGGWFAVQEKTYQVKANDSSFFSKMLVISMALILTIHG